MNRFDVWLVMKDPEKGRVINNLGLCTIVTPDELIELPSLIVAPMTTESESLASRIECRFDNSIGYIMVDQLKTIDKFSDFEVVVQIVINIITKNLTRYFIKKLCLD